MSDTKITTQDVMILSGLMFLLGMLAGGILIHSFTEAAWIRETLKRGLSEYNRETGAWQWKPEANKEAAK